MSKITPTLLSQVSNRKFGNLGRSNNLFRDSKLLPLTFQLKTVKVMRILEMARVFFFLFKRNRIKRTKIKENGSFKRLIANTYARAYIYIKS